MSQPSPNQKLFKIAVSAFIIKDEKLLILKRGDEESFLPSTWEVPGGGVEAAETIEAAIIRETKEEAGLSIVPKTLFSYFEYLDGEGQKTVNLNFLCHLTDRSQEVDVTGGEMQEARWISLSELNTIPFTSFDMAATCQKSLGIAQHT